MSIIDIVLIIPLAYGFIQGLRKGFVAEIGAFLAIIIGIYVARYCAESVSHFFIEWFDMSARNALIVSYILTFVVGTLGVHFVAYAASKFLKVIRINWLNRIIGAVFGTFKWLLILSLCLNLIGMVNSFSPVIDNKAVRNSVLYKPIENTMTHVVPFLNFDKFKRFISDLSK